MYTILSLFLLFGHVSTEGDSSKQNGEATPADATIGVVDAPAAPGVFPVGPPETDLQLAMRELWNGHIVWVRSVVFAHHYGSSESADAAEANAVANARSIADAVIPFYGQDASDQLFDLLAGHYGAIVGYMKAEFAGRDQAARQSTDELLANAEKIADFLDAANPYLPKESVLPMLSTHGSHHIQQIDAVSEEKFDTEGDVWNAMVTHINALADAMAGALAKQFPDKVDD